MNAFINFVVWAYAQNQTLVLVVGASVGLAAAALAVAVLKAIGAFLRAMVAFGAGAVPQPRRVVTPAEELALTEPGEREPARKTVDTRAKDWAGTTSSRNDL